MYVNHYNIIRRTIFKIMVSPEPGKYLCKYFQSKRGPAFVKLFVNCGVFVLDKKCFFNLGIISRPTLFYNSKILKWQSSLFVSTKAAFATNDMFGYSCGFFSTNVHVFGSPYSNVTLGFTNVNCVSIALTCVFVHHIRSKERRTATFKWKIVLTLKEVKTHLKWTSNELLTISISFRLKSKEGLPMYGIIIRYVFSTSLSALSWRFGNYFLSTNAFTLFKNRLPE